VPFNYRLRSLPCVLQGVKFALGDAECLNELDATVGRIDGFECWVVEECKANDLGVIVGTDGAVSGNPMVLFEPFAAFKHVSSQVLQEIADLNRLFGRR